MSITGLIDDLVKLDDIAEMVFNITPKIARRKAAANTLPIPAFRITGGGRGPWYVRREDVQALIAGSYGAAKHTHDRLEKLDARIEKT